MKPPRHTPRFDHARVIERLRASAPDPVDGPVPLDQLRPERHALRLPAVGGRDESWHIFTEDELLALQAVVATGRPLLVQGRPGVGKSQVARALAVALGSGWLQQVVDERTEPRDLLHRVDHVRRLAAAQALAPSTPAADREDALAMALFTDWGAIGAALLVGPKQPAPVSSPLFSAELPSPELPPEEVWSRRPVVLIDEIDKADRGVPNALLEVLSAWGLAGPDGKRVCVESRDRRPLVILTSNEERELPDALLRRCLSLTLELPDERGDRARGEAGPGDGASGDVWAENSGHTDGAAPENPAAAFAEHLARRAWPRFVDRAEPQDRLEPALLVAAAELLWEDRQACIRYRAGQAEYLDLLDALVALARDGDDPATWLGRLRAFYFQKGRR